MTNTKASVASGFYILSTPKGIFNSFLIASFYHQVTTTRKYILNMNDNNQFQAYYTILESA